MFYIILKGRSKGKFEIRRPYCVVVRAPDTPTVGPGFMFSTRRGCVVAPSLRVVSVKYNVGHLLYASSQMAIRIRF